ncbi:TetR/AcrR family transcriptional regulator [Ilumatobacter sp.]|uniref:TetR/AcrR family transcriptional regulator n=1 Tax=Ilumatobacter sp. TaxID=1967498 RepID=UPI003C4283BC
MSEVADASFVPSSLREDNRRRLRERVVAAAVELVRESGDVSFTMPAVAERSGVSLRTLYRHFPSRADLVEALASVADQVVELSPPTSLDEIEPWLCAAWTNLMAEEALLRAQHLGASGTALRRARTPRHRSATAAVIDALCPGLAENARAEIIDATLLLTSSTALFEFVDVLEVSVERGAHVAARAVQAILATHC